MFLLKNITVKEIQRQTERLAFLGLIKLATYRPHMSEMVYNTLLGFNQHIIVALRTVYQCGSVKYDGL